MSTVDQPHGVALLGAGIFAKTAHLPAIAAADSLKLLAVYSRSLTSATELSEAAKSHPTIKSAVDVYADDSSAKGDLDALLARKDVEAVILALPITLQPSIIEKAWKAGKNVISEKPVAPDLAEARRMIALYEKEYKPKGISWIVAEQFPYEASFNKAREMIAAGKIGSVHSFTLDFFHYVPAGSKYHATSWREKPQYQGGFLLDGGVHFTAGLRHMLPHPIVSVTSTRALIQPHLAPYDFISGLLTTSDPLLNGTFTISFGIEGAPSCLYTLRGTKGVLTVMFGGPKHVLTLKTLSTNPDERQGHEVTIELPSAGVPHEFEAFGEALTEGMDSESWKLVESRSGPRACMRDLGIIEGALTSGETGARVDLVKLGGDAFWDI